MVRIIVSIVLLVLLSVLVSLNLAYTTSVNLLGARIVDNVSVVAVSALSFAFGILYSFFIYVGSYLRRKAKRELASKGRSMKDREKQLDSREAVMEHSATLVTADPQPQITMPIR
jgi:uncharacterized membrane protein YciS (DUF1049 family)